LPASDTKGTFLRTACLTRLALLTPLLPPVLHNLLLSANKHSGFCKHRSTDFGPWHRAYMKMFEDALIKTCQDVAGEQSQKQKVKT
jgi:hypothetical protein